MKLLTARGLGFSYPASPHAVRDLDLTVERGQVLVVCGPNGSGKSTLLRLLGGLLRPERGQVQIEGLDLARLSPRERARKLALVPQQLPHLPRVSVASFVLAGRYARIDRWRGPVARDHRAVDLALAASDVAELGRRSMDELSGGQRQRVLLARALAQEAEALLIDEPTNALDPEHQVAVFDLIAELGRNQRGVVVVTHDLNLASQFASSILLMRDGRRVHEGPPAEVLRPEVLTPVYGDCLHYGNLPPPESRPFVLPWLPPGRRTGLRREDSPAGVPDGRSS